MGLVQAGSDLTAALLNALGIQAVIKPTDQSVTSSAVLVNDNALVLPVLANATYVFGCFLDFEGASSAGNLQFQWVLPSGASLRYTAPHVNASGANILNTTNTGSSNVTAATQGAATLCGILMLGTLNISSTAGSIQLEWAQNGSNGTATIVHAQSLLALWRVT